MGQPDGLSNIHIPGLIGLIICLSLYGITLSQTIYFFISFSQSQETAMSKLLVYGLGVADTIHAYMVCSVFWDMFILRRLPQSNNLHSFVLPWEMGMAFLIAAVMILVVQMFFCMRVWIFSNKQWPLVIIIGVSSLVQFATGLQSAIRMLSNSQVTHVLGGHRRETTQIQLICGIICVGTISCSLVYYLNARRSGMPWSEPVVSKLIAFAINTGSFLCVVTIGNLILFQFDPASAAIGPHIFLCQLYANTLNAALNSRKRLR
ncbi:hypothetical protein FIBSPDRAFT_1039608, partial [Athelia psychrophila]